MYSIAVIHFVLPLILGALFGTSSALADQSCHDLAGQYDCADEYADVTPVTLSFSEPSGVRVNEDLLLFSDWRRLKDSQGLIDRHGRASCQSGVLNTEFRGTDINRAGKPTGTISWSTTWRRNGNSLVAVSEGELKPIDGRPETFRGEFRCTAVPPTADAGSCPALSGQYSCPRPDGSSQTVTVRQSVEGSLNVYTIDDYRIVADGKARPVTGTGTYRNGTLKAWCETGKLKMQVDADFYPDGRFAGRMKMELTRQPGENGELLATNRGSLQYGQQIFPIRGQGSCAKTGK